MEVTGRLSTLYAVDAYPDRLLGLIGDLHGIQDVADFRASLIPALMRVVPSDYVSVNDIGPDPASIVVLSEPEISRDLQLRFGELAHENPLIVRHMTTRDGRAYRFSDVATPEELGGLRLFREIYGPLGVRYQIAFTLPHEQGRLLGVALSRKDRDYSDEERDLLNRARPFLIQDYRSAIELTELHAELERRARFGPSVERLVARGLTAREADVLCAVAMGRSNRAAAAQLGISERTAQKHLERSYRKLGVRSRSQAATIAWAVDD